MSAPAGPNAFSAQSSAEIWNVMPPCGRAVGEELRDDVLRRQSLHGRARAVVLQLAGLLDHAARDQPAHRVRDDVDLVRTGLAPHEHDQVIETPAAVSMLKPFDGDLLLRLVDEALEDVLVRRGHERRRGLVIEPVDPDRLLRELAVRRASSR